MTVKYLIYRNIFTVLSSFLVNGFFSVSSELLISDCEAKADDIKAESTEKALSYFYDIVRPTGFNIEAYEASKMHKIDSLVPEEESRALIAGHELAGQEFIYTLKQRIKMSTFYPQLSYDSKDSSDRISITGDWHNMRLLPYEKVQSIAQQVNLLPSPPKSDLLSAWAIEKYEAKRLNQKYRLNKNFARGNFGEVWYATGVRIGSFEQEEEFVLKRIFCEKGESLRLSGKRETHFGYKLKNMRTSRFIESFNKSIQIEKDGEETTENELWLVFRNEGRSMDALLYQSVETDQSVFLESSDFWRNLRSQAFGWTIRRELMRQILEGLAHLQEEGVVHRDLKPSNIFVSHDLQGLPHVRLGDFGSAIDLSEPKLMSDFYGKNGADQAQETTDYEPPEARLGVADKFPYFDLETQSKAFQNSSIFHAFDIWSCGVVFLEMLLTTEKIFAPKKATRRKVDVELTKRTRVERTELKENVRQQAYFIAGLQDFGIDPYSMDRLKLNASVASVDPFGRGFYDNKESGDLELDLLFKMLQWRPENRENASSLLIHPFFSLDADIEP